MGIKSQHVMQRREKAIQAEQAKKGFTVSRLGKLHPCVSTQPSLHVSNNMWHASATTREATIRAPPTCRRPASSSSGPIQWS